MPRLNSKGQATTGYSVTWYDDNLTFKQVCSVSGSSEKCQMKLSDGTLIADRGANYFQAANTHWICWLGNYGVFNSYGEHFPAAGMDRPTSRLVAADGTMAYKTVYQSNGPWTMRHPNGTTTQFGGDCQDVQVIADGQLVWTEGGLLHSLGISTPLPTRKVWAPTFKDGHLLYQDQATGCLVFDDKVVAPSGNYFRPDFMITGDNVHVVWSSNEGDTDVIVKDFTLSALASLPTVGASAPPTSGGGSTTTGSMTMQAFERKMWIAPFFSHSERYGMTATADHVGNAIIITEDMSDAGMAQVFALGFPMIIASAQMNADRANTTIAYWTGNAAEAQSALANPVEKPVIWYEDVTDANSWPASRPAWVNERVWPTAQCYRAPGEALTTFESRMRAMLDRIKSYGRPMFLVPRFDDFNGTGTIAQTLEAMLVYQKLLADYEIVGFMPFADRRGNGIAKNQSLHDWAMAFKMANPARPNRFDYWQPASVDMTTLLKNKLGQSTLLITLTDAEKKFILDALQAPPATGGGTTQPPTSLQWPNLQGVLEAERAKYPEMITADQCVAIINAVAASHPGLGLLKKPGGNHGLQPKSGIPCSVDWVIMKDGRGADVLSDGGNIDGTLGRATPSWPAEPSSDTQDPNNWVAPTA